MKTKYKVCLFFNQSEEHLCNHYKNFLLYIIDKYNININFEFTRNIDNEYDLILYSINNWKLYTDKIIGDIFFNKVNINAKILCVNNYLEGHQWPYSLNFNWDYNKPINSYSNNINFDYNHIRTLYNFLPYYSEYKCYGVTSYSDSIHNCYYPLIIDSSYDLVNNMESVIKRRQHHKDKFCCMCYRHGTYEREQIIKNIIKQTPENVDSFGNYLNNQGNIYYDDDTLYNSIMPSYKFCICFENTHSDYDEGYMTEKLVKGFLGGTVPIYWGNNKQIYEIFNKKSFINLTDIPINEWTDIIIEYHNNDNLYNQMLNETPIINNAILNYFTEKLEKFYVKVLTEEY